MIFWNLLMACGDKCPEGYEVNEEEKACYPIEDDTNSTDTDTTTVDTGDTTDTGGTDTDTTDTEVIDPFAEYTKISGKVIIPSLFEGRIIPRSAYHYELDGELLIVMSASSSATCDDVADVLGASGTNPDPSGIFIQDHCNLRIHFADSTDLSSGEAVAECLFGPGSFNNVGGQWHWIGSNDNNVDSEYFQATATASNFQGLEFDGDRAAIEVEITEWAGVFPYSNNYTTSEAVGTGMGYIISEACPALENTIYLGVIDNQN